MKGFPEIQCFPSGWNLGLPRQGLFFPLDHRGSEIWGPLPPPRPSQLRWSFRQYFGVKIMYRATFYSNLLMLFFLSLLIVLFLIAVRGKIFLFISWQNTYSSFWGFFCGGQSFFWSIWGKNAYTGVIILFFSSYLLLLFSSYLLLLFSSYLFLFFLYYILPLLKYSFFLYLNCLLYYRHAE